MSAKIQYNPVGDPATYTTITTARGPVNFACSYAARRHANLATSGSAVETVTENLDMIITCEMPHMLVASDYPDWCAFMAWALQGKSFRFYPCSTLATYYNCVDDSDGNWAPARTGPGKYGASFRFRILQDAQAPSNPGVVMERWYGIVA